MQEFISEINELPQPDPFSKLQDFFSRQKIMFKISLLSLLVAVIAIPSLIAFDTNTTNKENYSTHAQALSPVPQFALQSNATSTTQTALTWQSANAPSVAHYEVLRNGNKITTTGKYTTNFLDKGLTPNSSYIYQVEALTDAGTIVQTSNKLTVQTASSAQTISQCNYEQPLSSGNYILTSDVTTATDKYGCINFDNAKNLTLDCQGHTISDSWIGSTSLDISNTSHFLLVNCVLPTASGGITTSLQTSSNGTVEDNTFEASSSAYLPGAFGIGTSTNMIINHNQFNNVTYGQSSSNNFVGHNTFIITTLINQGGGSNAILIIKGGNNNVVADNYIHGVVGPSGTHTGSDDGILLGYSNIGNNPTATESGDVIVNNTISNVFDCGIESLGLVENSLFQGNKVSYAGSAAICSYYSTSLLNNQFIDNQVSNSDYLFAFNEANSQLPPDQSVFYFKNNTFTGNVYNASSLPTSGTSLIYFTYPAGLPLDVKNNVFTNNNFGHKIVTPYFTPKKMVVDGGGNTCILPTPAQLYPLKCN